MVGRARHWPAFYYCSSQLPAKTQASLKTIPSVRKAGEEGEEKEEEEEGETAIEYSP